MSLFDRASKPGINTSVDVSWSIIILNAEVKVKTVCQNPFITNQYFDSRELNTNARYNSGGF